MKKLIWHKSRSEKIRGPKCNFAARNCRTWRIWAIMTRRRTKESLQLARKCVISVPTFWLQRARHNENAAKQRVFNEVGHLPDSLSLIATALIEVAEKNWNPRVVWLCGPFEKELNKRGARSCTTRSDKYNVVISARALWREIPAPKDSPRFVLCVSRQWRAKNALWRKCLLTWKSKRIFTRDCCAREILWECLDQIVDAGFIITGGWKCKTGFEGILRVEFTFRALWQWIFGIVTHFETFFFEDFLVFGVWGFGVWFVVFEREKFWGMLNL